MLKYIHFTHRTSSMFQQPWINAEFMKFMSENIRNKFHLDVLQFYLKTCLQYGHEVFQFYILCLTKLSNHI